jgi:copper(I)-binding protein
LKNRAAFFYAWLCAVLLARSVIAQAPTLLVQNAWIRQVPGSDVAAVYLTLRNPTSKPVNIVGVESPVANHAMIHETKIDTGRARMRPHEQLVVPPGRAVKLEPDGLHVMLDGLTRKLAVGQSVPLTLTLADGSRMQVVALVRPLYAQ